MNPKYAKQRAICLLAAALEHLGIPYLADPAGLVVEKGAGGLIWVKINPGGEEVVTPDLIELNAAEVIGRNQVARDRCLHVVTVAAGYGSPKIIDRGPAPTARVYGDDPDRVIFRESVFRNTVNPTPKVYERLEPVIMTCVRFFYRKNRDLCVRLGYEIGDLKTYAQVWTANFWNTGRTLINEEANGNERLLYNFLRQRFSEFNQQMRVFRTRSTLADRQSIQIGLGTSYVFEGTSDASGSLLTAVKVSDDDENTAWPFKSRQRIPEIDVSDPDARRASAKALLLKRLNDMPHAEMLDVLMYTARSVYACPDARSEAVKQLVTHKKSCPACEPTTRKDLASSLFAGAALQEEVGVSLDVGEEVSGVDSGSSLE
jgi:hypothetical protein